MATWVAGMTNPFVVKGDTTRSEREYTVKANQTFKKGELIRVNTSGQIQIASLAITTVKGPCHGIAGADAADYLTDGDHAGETIPVMLFNGETVFGIQAMAAKDQDDYTIGASYGIAVASNKWTLNNTAGASGFCKVVAKPANDQWFDPDAAADIATGAIYVSINQSILDVIHAAT